MNNIGMTRDGISDNTFRKERTSPGKQIPDRVEFLSTLERDG